MVDQVGDILLNITLVMMKTWVRRITFLIEMNQLTTNIKVVTHLLYLGVTLACLCLTTLTDPVSSLLSSTILYTALNSSSLYSGHSLTCQVGLQGLLNFSINTFIVNLRPSAVGLLHYGGVEVRTVLRHGDS